MASTITPPVKVGPSTYKYVWTGTEPFRVFDVRGQDVLIETDTTEWTVTSSDSEEPPSIVVADSTEDITTTAPYKYNRRPRIQWRGSNTADYYTVERYNGSTWDEMAVIYETGIGYYSVDDTARSYYDEAGTKRYRVTMTDKEGTASTTINIDFFVFGVPEAPSIAITYSSGTGNATVAAR